MPNVDIEGQALTRLTSIEQLLLNAALYAHLIAGPEELDLLAQLRFEAFQFDTYCIHCKNTATFKATHSPYRPNNPKTEADKTGFFSRGVACTRANHHYSYWLFRGTGKIWKVGQSPSLEDIHGADLRRFDKIISQEDSRELRTAGGLFAHGLGVGSFAYIRRVYERMIERHRGDKVIDGWQTMRMDDKIQALRDMLPPALVKHKVIYGILSKGIHELTEVECKAYFPAMKRGIVLMLEQELEARERKKAEEELEREVQRITSEVSGRNAGAEQSVTEEAKG